VNSPACLTPPALRLPHQVTCTATDAAGNSASATFMVTVAFPAEEYDQKVQACKAARTATGAALRQALTNLGLAFKGPGVAVCPLLRTAQNALAPFKRAEKDTDEMLTKVRGMYKC
jgi:hypothetical protein